MTNSLPWKIPPFLGTVNHLFLWVIYTMAMLVITRWYTIVRIPHIPFASPTLRRSEIPTGPTPSDKTAGNAPKEP